MSLCFCRNIYTSAGLVQTNAFSALSKAHRDCKKAKGKTSKLERQQRERKKNHATPPTVCSRAPTQLVGPHTLPRPGRIRVLQWKTERAGRGGTGRKPPAERGRHRRAESARRGLPGGQCCPPNGRTDERKPRATGSQLLLPPKEHPTLHLLGRNSGATLSPCVRGRVPRPLRRGWAEIGCDTRLSPEAVSTEGSSGSRPRAWPTTASNTEEAAALLRGFCGCRGRAGRGGPPRGAPSP